MRQQVWPSQASDHSYCLPVTRAIARDGGEAGGPSESRPLRTRAGREGSHAVGGYAGELFS